MTWSEGSLAVVRLAMGLVASGAAALGLGACGAGDDVATAAELEAALETAEPGQRVRLGPGVFMGAFTVPAGVVLEGAGSEETTLVAFDGEPALAFEAGANANAPTTLDGLTVTARGGFAVVGVEPGHVVIRDAVVRADPGVGLGFQGAAGLALQSVRVEAGAGAIPRDPTPSTSPTHGIVLLSSTATLTDVEIAGFSQFGALFVESDVTWTEGGVTDSTGVGLMVSGGVAELDQIGVAGTRATGSIMPAYGVVVAQDAVVRSEDLDVASTQGVGLLQSGSRVDLDRLVAADNSEGGVWAQNTTHLTISGAGTTLMNNQLAGVVAVASTGVTITDAMVEGTRAAPRLLPGGGLVMVGDGVQLNSTVEGVTLGELDLIDNARVGLLVDLDGSSTEQVSLDSVRVEGSGAQLGVVAQGGEVLEGWDAEVLRSGAVALNDEGFAGALDLVGAVAPSEIPAAIGMNLSVFGAVAPSE